MIPRSVSRTLVLLVVAGAAIRVSAAPTIDAVDPPGWHRGAEVEVTFTGRELGSPAEVFFERGGIEVVAVEGVDVRRVKARIRIPGDCPVGAHRVRIRTATGLSELRTFRVGTLPHRPETEPNDTPADAPEIDAAGTTVVGRVRAEDQDCVRVRLRAGERVAVAIEAMSLDQEFFDPAVEILSPDGNVVASADDHHLLGQDAMLAWTAVADGDHVVRVREASWGGSDGSLYLLHVGRFPVAHVAWPPGGAPGAALEVEWLGDASGPFRETITLPEPGIDGLAHVRPSRDGSVAPVSVPLRPVAAPVVFETEAGDPAEPATRATAPVAIAGRLGAADDVDWLRIEAPAGSAWRVRVFARRVGSRADPVVSAHRPTKRRERLAANDDTEGPDSVLDVRCPEDGAFLLRIGDHRRRGGDDYPWWIEVEPVRPSVTLSVPPGRANTQERLVAAVPRGNRTALVFNAARDQTPDDLRFSFRDLPPGVQATGSVARSNAPGQVIVFEAAADAPPGTSMVAADVFPAGSATAPLLGGIRQRTSLVFGFPNQTTYRTSTSDRVPVAVVDAVPVTIEVDAPRGPLVRRGTLDLAVRIRRAPGYDEKLRLGFPFKPPGIGAGTDVDVADGVEEVVFPINAAPDAPLGEWSVVVTAAERRRDGPGFPPVSSRPVQIRVTEPVVEVAATKTVVPREGEGRVVCRLEKRGTFSGRATARLLGLPAGVTSDPVDFDSAAAEIAFPIRVSAEAPVGKHDSPFARIEVPLDGTTVVHRSPALPLRVDPPVPAGAKRLPAASRREELRARARSIAEAAEVAASQGEAAPSPPPPATSP